MTSNNGVPTDAQVAAAIQKAEQKHKKPAAALSLEQVRAFLPKDAGTLTQERLNLVRAEPQKDAVDHSHRPDARVLGQDAHAGIKDNKDEAALLRARFKKTKAVRGGKPQETFELMGQLRANKNPGMMPSRKKTDLLPGQADPAHKEPSKP